jgi:hypothetical protein
MIAKGRPPGATPEQIIAAYRECRNVEKVCRDLRSGSNRVERILDEAGVPRVRRPYRYKPRRREAEEIPDKYVAAIAGYQAGDAMTDLRDRFDINFAQLYRWLDVMGVPRRAPAKKPKQWHCLECGDPVPSGEMFCGDQHRRDYNAAAIAPGFVPPRHHRKENQDAEASSQAAPPSHGDQPRA